MTPPTPRFAAYFKVRHYEMDALGHVNNAVYLHYLEQAAIEHSAALGFTVERLTALGGVFIARRHEIDYLRPASAGDILQVVTWAEEMRGAQAARGYEIYRYAPPADEPPGASDGGVPADGFLPPDFVPASMPLVRARTQWVWVDPVRGRPRRMPAGMAECFLRERDAAQGGREGREGESFAGS